MRKRIAQLTGVEAALKRRLNAQQEVFAAEIERYELKIQTQNAELEELANQIEAEQRRAEGAEYLYRTNRRLATDYAELARTFDRLPRYQYGSLLPGNDRWAEKWKSAEGRRILMFANRDYSGSFYKWAAAINDHTENAARLVVTVPHRYGYDVDLLLPNPALIDSSWEDLWSEADLLHLKDETGFFRGPNTLPVEMLTSFQGPRIFTQYGGYARSRQDNADYQEFVKSFDLVVSMTPDLCFKWLGPNPIYIPHSIDTEKHSFTWLDSPVIGHSPSTRARKGTEDFLAAVSSLQNDFALELELIEGVRHDEVMDRKRTLGLFFDQAGRESMASMNTDAVIGWYGNSAIEAAVYGVPTIAHLSEAALANAERAGVPNIRTNPIVNTPLGVEGIRETLRSLLTMSGEERLSLAHETRRFIEEFHSQSAVAKRLQDAYDYLVS